MSDIFFQEKGKMVLLTLRKEERSYVSSVARKINCTYAHTFNLIKEMERQEIVSASKRGRTKYISLTQKGKELADVMNEFIRVLNTGKRKGQADKKISQTLERLYNYQEKVESIHDTVRTKGLNRGEMAKYKRLCGRYKSLVLKVRPRDKDGKKIKSNIISKLDEINVILGGGMS
jgi:predicted transcriptional regulator